MCFRCNGVGWRSALGPDRHNPPSGNARDRTGSAEALDLGFAIYRMKCSDSPRSHLRKGRRGIALTRMTAKMMEETLHEGDM